MSIRPSPWPDAHAVDRPAQIKAENQPTEKGKPGASRGRKARGLARREIARLPVHTEKGAYEMTDRLFSLRARMAVASGVLATMAASALMVSPAVAKKPPPPAQPAACLAPALTQPFLSAHDQNWYALAPGQSVDNFDGLGWTLRGGAALESARLADGQSGSVLDMPSGSRAVSPPVCVNFGFKAARTMVRSVAGKAGVRVGVSYDGTGAASSLKNSGRFHGHRSAWTVSRRINVKPSNVAGWQVARFVLSAEGRRGDFQIYDFYVDPRMKG